MAYYNLVKIGPVGSKNGNPCDRKGCNKIVQIFVSHGLKVHSLQLQYVDENGNLVLSDRHGANNGNKFKAVKLNYPSEYITYIKGHYCETHLCSITFGTNLRKHGPLGNHTGTSAEKEFIFRLGEGRQFAGFHGTADDCVNSIGVYLKPVTSDKNNVNIKKEG